METVTFKLHENILEKVDLMLKPLHFNNRTEFIREAVREKLNAIEKDVVLRELERFKGSASVSVSNKRLREVREEIGKTYAKKFGIKLD